MVESARDIIRARLIKQREQRIGKPISARKQIRAKLKARTVGRLQASREKPKEYTGREWLQETTERMMESEKQWKEIEQKKSEIIPTTTYAYFHLETGEKTHLLGQHFISMYMDPASEQAKTVFLQRQRIYQQAQFLPSSTTIKETRKGFEIHRDIVAEE